MGEPDQYNDIYKTPVGYIGINRNDRVLTRLDFLGDKPGKNKPDSSRFQDNEVGVALKHYFTDPFALQIPDIELNGTEFQKKVWHLMAAIAPGKTRTYGDIAAELNTSPRAVGNACRANPVPIFIPCHRVVAKSGKGGFMGQTQGSALAIKDWLLNHEQAAPGRH